MLNDIVERVLIGNVSLQRNNVAVHSSRCGLLEDVLASTHNVDGFRTIGVESFKE